MGGAEPIPLLELTNISYVIPIISSSLSPPYRPRPWPALVTGLMSHNVTIDNRLDVTGRTGFSPSHKTKKHQKTINFFVKLRPLRMRSWFHGETDSKMADGREETRNPTERVSLELELVIGTYESLLYGLVYDLLEDKPV